MKNKQELIFDIIQIVPKGKVIYYSQISDCLLAFHDIFLRGQVVGWQMSGMKNNPKFQKINWQRVIAKSGQIVTYKLGFTGSIQFDALIEEGVIINEGLIDLETFGLPSSELSKLYQAFLNKASEKSINN